MDIWLSITFEVGFQLKEATFCENIPSYQEVYCHCTARRSYTSSISIFEVMISRLTNLLYLASTKFTSLYNRPSENPFLTRFLKKRSLGWSIFHRVFIPKCVLPIREERGGRSSIFTRINIFLQREELNDLYSFCATFIMITCTLRILFLSMVI